MGLCDTPSITFLRGKMLYHVVCDRWYIDENASLPKKLRFYRTKGRMDCNTLAELIRVSRFAIMRYESGETEPTLEDLKKMAVVFGIEADKLYDDYYRFLDYPYTRKIREIRKEQQMTQREFGGLLGVTVSTVKRWESGRHNVPRDVWEKLNGLCKKESPV